MRSKVPYICSTSTPRIYYIYHICITSVPESQFSVRFTLQDVFELQAILT